MRFFTSIPGFMTGLATVATATAAITTALIHTGSSAAQPPAPPSGTHPAANAGTSPAASAATPASSGAARHLWGPGTLVITNSGTDIHSIPPISNGGSSDVHDDGTDLWPDNNAQLAVWPGDSAPTPQQCLYLIRIQGTGADVAAPVRAIVCAQTSENTLAIIQVQSIDISLNFPTTTQTTIYAIPPSG